MDLINWNEFCKTYDMKYIDKLSENGKLLLQKQLRNKNVKFEGLKRILNLYFNPPHNIITKCDIISPLISLSYHTSSIYNKYIYIFGEQHGSVGTCSIKNVYDFIINQISNIPKMIDVFLETPYIHKTGKYSTPLPVDILTKFRYEFKKCLDIKKNCQYPNIRFHNADIRSSMSVENPFLLQLENYIVDIYYDIINKDNISYKSNKNNLIDLLTNKKYKQERDKYQKAFKSSDLLIKYLLETYNKFKLEKQQEKISSQQVKDLLLLYFTNSIEKKSENLKFLQLHSILQEIKKFPINIPKKIPNYLEKLSSSMIQLIAPVMDMYLVARMFRTFKNVKYQNSKEPQYIIIYVGNFHANIYRDILFDLEFKTKFKSISKPNEFCVDTSKLKLPLFS